MKNSFYASVMIASWILFFVAQVYILDEVILTILAIALSSLLFWRYERNEYRLYLLGVTVGLTIEVGLGQIARTQHWTHASLYGVPYWLPLAWGYGFVVMRRIGNVVVRR